MRPNRGYAGGLRGVQMWVSVAKLPDPLVPFPYLTNHHLQSPREIDAEVVWRRIEQLS